MLMLMMRGGGCELVMMRMLCYTGLLLLLLLQAFQNLSLCSPAARSRDMWASLKNIAESLCQSVPCTCAM